MSLFLNRRSRSGISFSEVYMPAYLLLVLAVLTRVMPHHGWLNFTAVGGALLYFGARRSWREMLAPLAALMVTDYCLTVFAYHYSFVWTAYVTTWAWYLAVMVLGHILLKSKTTWLRAGSAAILGPTSFWLISNYGVWAMSSHAVPVPSDMYPHTLSGLIACYVAAIPFYRNDLVATTLVVALAFGLPVLIRKLASERNAGALAVR